MNLNEILNSLKRLFGGEAKQPTSPSQPAAPRATAGGRGGPAAMVKGGGSIAPAAPIQDDRPPGQSPGAYEWLSGWRAKHGVWDTDSQTDPKQYLQTPARPTRESVSNAEDSDILSDEVFPWYTAFAQPYTFSNMDPADPWSTRVGRAEEPPEVVEARDAREDIREKLLEERNRLWGAPDTWLPASMRSGPTRAQIEWAVRSVENKLLEDARNASPEALAELEEYLRQDPYSAYGTDLRIEAALAEHDRSTNANLESRLFQTRAGNVRDVSDRFNDFNARQQGALTFNKGLFTALETDKLSSADAPLTGTEEYYSKVDEMFGVKGGSDIVSPAVVDYLYDLGYRDTEFGDLDNFLNGSGYITDDVLNRYLESDTVDYAGDDLQLLTQLNLSELSSNRLTEALISGQNFLDSFKASGTDIAGDRVQYSGLDLSNASPALLSDLQVLTNMENDPNINKEMLDNTYLDIAELYNIPVESLALHFERMKRGYNMLDMKPITDFAEENSVEGL